jgi:hypothetical protein
MGRSHKKEGTKNLAKVLDNPRFTKVFVTKGNSRMPMLLSTASFDVLAAGFERRGFTVEKAGQS